MTSDPRDGDPLRAKGTDRDPTERRRRYVPMPEDFDAMSAEAFDGYIERIGFADRIRDALAEPKPLPVAGHQGCARWWLLWLAVGAAFWAIVIALILANRAAPAAPSEGPDASVTVKGYADVPVLRGAPQNVGANGSGEHKAGVAGTPIPQGQGLASPATESGAPLPAVAARPQPSRARESAPATTPTAVVHRGVASHMGDSPDAGPRYLALPIGPGHRVRLCGAVACLTLTSTDAGPALFMQRRGRVADLSVELFEMLTGRPASRGLAPVSWKGME